MVLSVNSTLPALSGIEVGAIIRVLFFLYDVVLVSGVGLFAFVSLTILSRPIFVPVQELYRDWRWRRRGGMSERSRSDLIRSGARIAAHRNKDDAEHIMSRVPLFLVAVAIEKMIRMAGTVFGYPVAVQSGQKFPELVASAYLLLGLFAAGIWGVSTLTFD